MQRSRPRRTRLAALALALAPALAADCAPAQPRAPTAVERLERVSTGIPEYDAYFADIHTIQLALNEFERARLDALSRAGLDLGLLEGAELEAAANEVRRRATALDEAGIAINVQYETYEETATLMAASTQIGPPAQYETRARLELDAEGPELPPEGRTLLDALRRAMRALLGLRARMLAVAAVTPRLASRNHELDSLLAQRVPAGRRAQVGAELGASKVLLESVPERARAASQLAEQAIGRLATSATGR